jgi:tetratricopeptide (TPR) repeat protein
MLYLQARCESIAGNHDAERQLLQDAIAAKPDFGSAWEQLLSTTAQDQLEAFAKDCIAQATDAPTSANDKAILLYTAGRAFDQLGEFEQAFDQFDSANECQRGAARERGLAYDKEDVEDYIRQVQQDFTEPQGAATSSGADHQPIFIVGMVRSGTSLVEQILGGLDGVTMGGEADAVEVLTSKYYWSLNRGQAKPPGELDAADWDEFAAEYWQLQTVHESRVTDKAPLNFRHIGMMCAMFPDAPIIYVRRDPRDVALSIYSRYFSDAHYYATDPGNIVHFIGASRKLMKHWQHVFPERIIELEYEQLVADPENETRRLAEFCGLKWQASCLDFHERGDASYTFSAAQVREPLNAKGIGRWHHYADRFAPFIDAFAANDVALPDN